MEIRQETPADYDEVFSLVKESFATTSHSDGTEAEYLNEIRGMKEFIPELSLVALSDDNKIIGQIVLYETIIKTEHNEITELVLSPLSVHPDYFKKGIARALMEESFLIAKGMGYRAVFLCGDYDFYKKIGFKPSCDYGIFHVNDNEKNADWCMVRELEDDFLNSVNGTIDIL